MCINNTEIMICNHNGVFWSHWKWGCRSIFFDMKVFTLMWKDIHITWSERGKHMRIWQASQNTLGKINVYEAPQKQVWTGYSKIWTVVIADRTLPSGFYFINFHLVWIFIADKLKSGKITEMFPIFLHTQVSFSENLKLKFPGTLNSGGLKWNLWKSEMKWWWLGWEKSLKYEAQICYPESSYWIKTYI